MEKVAALLRSRAVERKHGPSAAESIGGRSQGYEKVTHSYTR